ncbi:ammonia-forming cytochrome c nitrite reductase subunit c552, partial [Vibrio sp. 10N.222.54.A1]
MKKHWIRNSVTALLMVSASLASATSFAASEQKEIGDPRNDQFEQNHPDQY